MKIIVSNMTAAASAFSAQTIGLRTTMQSTARLPTFPWNRFPWSKR